MDYKKNHSEGDTDGRNIADLCLMCGQCCIGIATEFTHEQLSEMAKNGEKEAHVFIDFFKKYKNIDEARKVIPEHVKQVLHYKYLPEDYSEDNVSFYYCDKITHDNKCTIYGERPVCCRMAPRDEWSLMPPKCGYAGWQYTQKERIKSNIRSIREIIYEIETLEGPDAFVEELNMTLKEVKEHVHEKALPFKIYGSAGW